MGISTDDYLRCQVDPSKKGVIQEKLKAFEVKLSLLEGLFEIQDCDGEDPILLRVHPCTSNTLGKELLAQLRR